jgi:hypothetical protein
MDKKIIIRGDRQKDYAKEVIDGLPLDPRHEVIIQEAVEDRRLIQNALFHLWCGYIANERGDSLLYIKNVFKLMVVKDIYLASTAKRHDTYKKQMALLDRAEPPTPRSKTSCRY